jgi:hypothetical protein
MTDVILRFDYIDDEIMWPEFRGGRLISGWVRAVSGIRRVLLNVVRIKKVYAYDGKLYVLYDAEDVQRYGQYLAQLPPLAVELDHEIYYERVYDGDCTCKIWRLSISTLYEEERFLQKLGAEVELEHLLPVDVWPVNFSIIPVDITLYTKRIRGIAVVKNPQFEGRGYEKTTYEGRYVILVDEYGGYALFRIKSDVDVDLKKLLGL